MTMTVSADDLKGAKEAIKEVISSTSCGPILMRLAWHDAGTYDASIGADKWPSCGGANGSIRFDAEMSHGANAGLTNAVVLLEGVKAAFPNIGYADLFQLASATAVEMMGGPIIPMKYGRKDATGPEMCHPEGNLPAGNAPFPKDVDAATHLRDVFHRMGLTDQDIVALSGAHTVGRAHSTRSGEGKAETKYTTPSTCPVGTKCTGGSSWTPDWTKFDNSYWIVMKAEGDADLLVLETDRVLFKDEKFKPFAEKYAESQDAFFADYATAHSKLSELGVEWVGEPVTI